MTKRLDQRTGRPHAMLDRYTRSVGQFVTRRRTEKALGSARVEAELASRAKTQFLSNMSHELRTPLNAIIGFSQMLASRKIVATLEHERYEYAEHIESAGKHLLAIVSDILDMSRIETGALTTEPVPCRIADLLSPCEVMMRDRFNAKRQAFRMTFGPDLARIEVDPRRFKQAVLNLLSNACKFTPPDAPIELSAWQSGDDCVEIVVADGGVGMSEEDMAIAMRPFGQVEAALSRQHEGAGLGLPLARRLTELQGGRFHIASQIGEGTRVTLSFAAAETASRAAPAHTRSMIA